MDEIMLLKQETAELLAYLQPKEDSVNIQTDFQWVKANLK